MDQKYRALRSSVHASEDMVTFRALRGRRESTESHHVTVAAKALLLMGRYGEKKGGIEGQ
jgi:hypothetical protein